jgi:hypothetical protein
MPIILEGQQKKVFTNSITSDELIHIIMGTFRLQMFKWRVANFQFDIIRNGRQYDSIGFNTYKNQIKMKKILPNLFATILAAFGLLTLFLSTSVIFDLFGIRAKEGNYVLFVVWSNFISSILYLFAAYGFVKVKNWTTILLGISTLILIVAFIGLKIHANSGGIYETKTIGAMIFRIAVTLVFAIIAFFTINKQLNKNHNE